MKEVQTVTATWARTHLGQVIRDAISTGQRFIVERDSIPAVVILSVVEYEQLQQQAVQSRLYALSRQAGLETEKEGLTEADIQAEIKAIKQQVYSERYGGG